MLPAPMDFPVAFDSSRLNNEANDCHLCLIKPGGSGVLVVINT